MKTIKQIGLSALVECRKVVAGTVRFRIEGGGATSPLLVSFLHRRMLPVALCSSLVFALGALAPASAQQGGTLDLDAMEVSENGDVSDDLDTLVLDEQATDGEEDFLLLDDVGPDDAASAESGDTLTLEDVDNSTDVTLDESGEMQLDDDTLVLDDVEDSSESDVAESDTFEMEDDTLVLEDAVLDEAEAADDVMVLDDVEESSESAVAESDILEMEDDTLVVEDAVPGELEAADDVMVLDDAGTEMSDADADLMEGLDAEMLGMEDVPENLDAEAGSGNMTMDEMPVAAAASGELSDLDAEMAGMMGGPGEGAASEESGDMVLDDGATEGAEVASESGMMVMEDGAGDTQEDEETSPLSVYAVLKNESAVFVKSGTPTGSETSTRGGGAHNAGKLFKFETSLNVFANAQITPSSSVHAQLNLTYDPKADPNWYRGPKSYTQNDPLRELYLDTTLPFFDDEGVSMRLGKQQVVWGTADGIKLLDIINPTDFRELVQNTFEDSRIPVWMMNLERNVGEDGNIQLIAAQAKRNRIPGLTEDGDSGQPFIAKGVDSITGEVNGFLNIAPAMGKVASAFNSFSALSGSPVGLTPLSFVTVNDFATNNPVAQSIFGSACSSTFNPATPTSATCLKDITERPNQTLAPGFVLPGGDNQFVTNLIDADTQGDWDPDHPTSAFEYMSNATFATFNTFVSAKSSYRRKGLDGGDANFGGRWKSSFGSNFNYSLNYFYAYDANPSISMHWENAGGETLKVKKVTAQQYVDAGILAGVPPGSADLQTIILKDDAGHSYGPFDGDPTSRSFGGPGAGTPTLVFVEEQHRIHNLGASFDYALDTAKLGSFVLRGEFLYQRDVRVPMVDRNELSIGNLTEGLFPDKVDFFKYVLGAETIVFTNLTVSAQFIQFVNLDFKDNDGVYHGNQAVLHLSNDLKKGYKYYNFGSLFLSKPFGTQQDGRVNNIIIAERGGGYWNRLDVEYRFTDQLIGSAEWNMYFGDQETQFGQFRDSSNFQLGVKYIFE